MKTNIIMAFAIAAVTSLTANAQPQKMQPYSGKSPNEVRPVMRIEGFATPEKSLNDQQREELKKIRTEQLKESVHTRNLIQKKRAELEILQTADKPDMKQINQLIDEIAAVQARQMKSQAVARQKIRSILNEEQRAIYDARGANQRSFNERPEARRRPRHP